MIRDRNREKQNRTALGRVFHICPVRFILLLIGGSVIGMYFLLRGKKTVLAGICEKIVRPYHRAMSSFCGNFSFSVGEVLISAAIISFLVYVVFTVVQLIRKNDLRMRLIRFIITCAALFAVIYGGYCLFWGVYYETDDFEKRSGIYAREISAEELESVTRYFTDLVNKYSLKVQRDENGIFTTDLDRVFDRSKSLYDSIEQAYPCLDGKDLRAKPFFFSRIMSYIDFTGFFFPFTGEANINVDSPACMIPSTIAHELAHQRGVAQEDEANFVSVLASLKNQDPEYCYSSCLLAYIYLGNALYKADRDAWRDNYARLDQYVLNDLSNNNAYWDQFETPVKKASNTVYSGFLQSYGQSDGLATYGKCVDLLVVHFLDSAKDAGF